MSLDLVAGEVHALVGENGAGKSTLVKILAGVHQPDTGTILLDGVETPIHGPAAARALGIAVVHQEPRLFPDLTVAENVFMAHAPRGALRSIDWGAMRRSSRAIFDQLGVKVDSSALVRGLSMADQQLIEIAKALSFDARVLILDEPTASLSAHEVERLFAIVRQTRDSGVAVLFVSHRLEEVFDLCDRATVFRDGRHVITAPTSELTTGDLVRHMVGRAVSLFPKVEAPVGEVLLEVRDLTRRETFNGVSFAVRAGEIVGMAGLVGAGPDGGRSRPVRDRPPGARRDPARRQAGHVRQPVRGDARRDRLRPRGPPPGRARPRLHDRVEHDPADPAAAVPGPVRPGLRRASDRPALRRPAPDPGDRRRPARVGACPAATSRRSSSANGSRPSHGSSSSTSRPAGSTSGPRSRSTGSSPSSPRPGWASS